MKEYFDRIKGQIDNIAEIAARNKVNQVAFIKSCELLGSNGIGATIRMSLDTDRLTQEEAEEIEKYRVEKINGL